MQLHLHLQQHLCGPLLKAYFKSSFVSRVHVVPIGREPNGKFLKQMGLLFTRGEGQSQLTNLQLVNESRKGLQWKAQSGTGLWSSVICYHYRPMQHEPGRGGGGLIKE